MLDLWKLRGTVEGCKLINSKYIDAFVPWEAAIEDEVCSFYIREVASRTISRDHCSWRTARCRVCEDYYSIDESVVLLSKKVTQDKYYRHAHTECLLSLNSAQFEKLCDTRNYLSRLEEYINKPLPIRPPELLVSGEKSLYA